MISHLKELQFSSMNNPRESSSLLVFCRWLSQLFLSRWAPSCPKREEGLAVCCSETLEAEIAVVTCKMFASLRPFWKPQLFYSLVVKWIGISLKDKYAYFEPLVKIIWLKTKSKTLDYNFDLKHRWQNDKFAKLRHFSEHINSMGVLPSTSKEAGLNL